MKKILVLAIAALPMFAMAQDKKETPVKGAPAQNEAKPADKTAPETFFLELIVTTGQYGTVIKQDIGREALTNLADKELVKQLGELRNQQFTNMPDALSTLAGMGFKFQNSYIVYDKDGKPETHMIFEKRLVRKPNNEGGARPSRPDRPTIEPKPQDKGSETKPSEKKPTSQPVEKK